MRESKESVPLAPANAANDSKLSHSQVQVIADSKTLQREHSNVSPEKEAENERRAPVVSISKHQIGTIGECIANSIKF